MTERQTLVTGIKTTGTPHLGNLAGAIGPAIAASRDPGVRAFYFLADYHALIGVWNPEALRRSTLEIAAAWLAFGLDPERVVFYRQSDIPEIFELTWILSCLSAKGLMNRAHAYKAAVAENAAAGAEDPDRGITMGLYNYPILMAADILMFRANQVPVGRDQFQHLEMTRDIAARFNHHFGEHFVLPEAIGREETAVLAGLDGRKMSKSYGNVIPLFAPRKALRKLVFRIKTDSTPPAAPKDPHASNLYRIYSAFASEEESRALAADYRRGGLGWGEAKERLFARLDHLLAEPRERYEALTAAPEKIEAILREGAEKARAEAAPFLAELRAAIGLTPLG
jgi:tryptophanyl-tRNA synthetase